MYMKRFIQTCFFIAALLAGASVHAQVPDDAVWIDVRTPAEYNQGHLEQAQLIPFDGIQAGIARLGLAKDAPIYLYCAVGGRAEKARQTLLAEGYSNVTNAGGLENARQLAADSKP
jgi:phage shock protein E